MNKKKILLVAIYLFLLCVVPLNVYAITYYVRFNNNGGVGTMSNQTFTTDEEKYLSTNTFTKAGYDFIGWNSNSSGTGTWYMPSKKVKNLSNTDGAIVDIYAQWMESNQGSITTGGSQFPKDTVGNYSYENYKNFTVSVTVNNGTVDQASKTIEYYTNATFTLTPTSGYGNGTVSCTNSQSASITNNTLTVTSVSNNTTCTVTFTPLSRTATFYYQNSPYSGGTGLSTATASCVVTLGSSCTVNIPNEVLASGGTYNNAYAGLNAAAGADMTPDIAKSSTTVTLSSDTDYFSIYSTEIKIYYPSSTSTASSKSTYQNQWYTSKTAMATTVLSDSATGTNDNATASLAVSEYSSLVGFSSSAGQNTAEWHFISTLTSSDSSGNASRNVYEIDKKSVTAVFYYYSGSAQTSVSEAGDQFLRCTSTSVAEIYDSDITVPTVVTNSSGPNGSTYLGLSASTSSTTLTTTITTATTTYYAVYDSSITATFTKENNNVSAIGSTSLSCVEAYTTDGSTYSSGGDCTITLPSITPVTGYKSIGWYDSNNEWFNYSNAVVILTQSETFTAKVKRLTASDMYYDNSNSGIECHDVQCMIDYLDPGNTITTSNLSPGDYVTYTPTKTSYTTDTDYTGYTSTQTINPSELNLWRVISLNGNGTVDIISENVSSTSVYFRGQTGYQNFVGYLNVLASQYENSNQTVGSRHFGYNGQTEFITDTSKFVNPAPWTCSTGGTCTPDPDDYESSGGGDSLYLDDYNLINTVLGTRVATNPSGIPTTYWMASRYYSYSSYLLYNWHARFVINTGDSSSNRLYYYGSRKFNTSNDSNALRPIVTLKSGLSYSGSGTSSNPYTID